MKQVSHSLPGNNQQERGKHMRIELLEALGRAAGGLVAPLAAEFSLMRGARSFHPNGIVYRGAVTPIATLGPVGSLAQRLAGPALLRLSGGLGIQARGKEGPDVLGISLRLCASETPSAQPAPGDQDLLFVSATSLWKLPFALLLTRAQDFMRNDYYALLPFDIQGIGSVLLRLSRHPGLAQAQSQGQNRAERLANAVAAKNARFQLELRRGGLLRPWQTVANIELIEAMPTLNQDALSFHPFRSGRGIRPRGFLQAMRVAVYPASQLGRHLLNPDAGLQPSRAPEVKPVPPTAPTDSSEDRPITV